MHEIIYRPFRNIFSYLGDLVYKANVEHALMLVEDSPGKIHFELKCNGPLKSRGYHERIYTSSPNCSFGTTILTMDCSEQHLEKLQEQMIEDYKKNRLKHLKIYKESVEALEEFETNGN